MRTPGMTAGESAGRMKALQRAVAQVLLAI